MKNTNYSHFAKLLMVISLILAFGVAVWATGYYAGLNHSVEYQAAQRYCRAQRTCACELTVWEHTESWGMCGSGNSSGEDFNVHCGGAECRTE